MIDLNADLGEDDDGVAPGEEAIFAEISSANVACGGHAGTDATMRRVVELAASFGVAIGAHPSFEDRAGFGRRALEVLPTTLQAQIVRQLHELDSAGAYIEYVKPHGALYHVVARDRPSADALVGAVAEFAENKNRSIAILGQGGEIRDAAVAADTRYFTEAFLDRAYAADGSLLPRGEPGAILQDAELICSRALRLVEDGVVEAVDGTLVLVRPASLCVHGDTPGALEILRSVRRRLDDAGITVRAPWGSAN